MILTTDARPGCSFLTVDIQAGRDVYLEGKETGGIFLGWDYLPEAVQEELAKINEDLKAQLARCAELIRQSDGCTPDEWY